MTQATASYDHVPLFTGEIANQGNSGFFQPVKPEASTALAASDQARAIAEVQAALVIAQANPRNELRARDRLMQACSRIGLAQGAIYDYPRGKEHVSGPSIRLAEAAARAWGNMTYGFREVARRPGESDCEAFAWDLETNTKAVRQFSVRHRRDTKQGGYDLKDERDIYEMVANYAQRRVRATIQEIIPGDIMEDAVAECQRTISANVGDIKAATATMLKMFIQLGVTKANIEQRLGNRLDTVQPGQIMKMWRIYNSVKDGMTSASDWFDMAAPASPDAPIPDAGPDATAKPAPEKKQNAAAAKSTTPPASTGQPAPLAPPAQASNSTAGNATAGRQATASPTAKPATRQPEAASAQVDPGDDYFPASLVFCQQKNKNVDEIDCPGCAMRKNCPTWE